MRKTRTLEAATAALREQGLGYPETTEDFPWGHLALKVRGKAFAFLGGEEGTLSISMKLPYSAGPARKLAFAEPTGYGLGRSGWITATFKPEDEVPLELLREWLLESYYAIAPKKVSDRLTDGDVRELGAATPPRKNVTSARAPRSTRVAKGTTAKRATTKRATVKRAAKTAKPAARKRRRS